MNHPFVKKLLRNELLMWGLGALVVVALPMGVVVLEATTVSSSSKRSSKGRTTSKSKKRTFASKPKTTTAAIAGTNLFHDTSDDIVDGVLDPAAVFGSSQNDGDSVVTGSSRSSEMGDSYVLSEVPSEAVGSGILYFGGGLADGSSEVQLDVATAEVTVSDAEVAVSDAATASNVDNRLPSGVTDVSESASSESASSDSASSDSVSTVGLSVSAGDPEEADPDLIALMAGQGTVVKQESGSKDKTQLSSSSKAADKDDTRERTEVTLIRPRGDVVKSIDEIIFRCRTHTKLFPYVLVRSRQKSAPWWVQNDTLRQGTYVRGRAQFGNRATLDGSRFSVLVAFVEDIEEVPEPGTQMMDVPEGVLVSQELEFTLRK